MTETIYRIQDRQGRGPFKPGMGAKWLDADKDLNTLPAWFQEFGWDLPEKKLSWEVMGCGFRSLDQLNRWFTESERNRLKRLGYRIVKMNVSRILAESETQLVFTRITPLKEQIEVIV